MCGGVDGCWEPPPDAILIIPPPPLPSFLALDAIAMKHHHHHHHLPTIESNVSLGELPPPCQHAASHHHSLLDLCSAPTSSSPSSSSVSSSSSSSSVSSSSSSASSSSSSSSLPGFEFVELSQHNVDDTWLLVLVCCSVGVLLLGTLLALILLKCRDSGKNGSLEHDESIYGLSSHSSKRHQHSMQHGGAGCDPVLYPRLDTAGRLLWATLTPAGGTTHSFCCPNNNNSMANNNFPRNEAGGWQGPSSGSGDQSDPYVMKLRPRVFSSASGQRDQTFQNDRVDSTSETARGMSKDTAEESTINIPLGSSAKN